MNIVSLNEHMALNFDEYMFLNEFISLNEYNFPEWIYFPWTRIYFLEWTDKFLEMNIIPWKNIIASNDYTSCE